MIDDVERVFSGCHRTISWERARLGLDKVEAVECLGSWFPLNAEDEVGGLGDDSEDTIVLTRIMKVMKWIRSKNVIVSVFCPNTSKIPNTSARTYLTGNVSNIR